MVPWVCEGHVTKWATISRSPSLCTIRLWKYPSHEDLQEVGPEQIVPCEVIGEWDMAPNSRERLFSVTNVKAISYAFQQYVL